MNQQVIEIPLSYTATPTLSQFHQSEAFYKGILGPVGSGKSSGCCWEIMYHASRQKPDKYGIRRSRWAVIRNTAPELRDTTIPTWLYWFKEYVPGMNPARKLFGQFHWTDYAHYIKIQDMEIEVLFRALDRPEDVKKVLSLEVSGVWINEAREIPNTIVMALGDRVGRYPSVADGGCSWSGVLMDTNPPDSDHWWPILADRDISTPRGRELVNSISQAEERLREQNLLAEGQPLFQFFRQPGGLLEVGLGPDGLPIFEPNPLAENLDNLEPGYYLKRMAGKSTNHIRIYYCAQYGISFDGKPIIPEYREQTHAAKEDLIPVKGVPIQWGIDWGLTPACVFGQKHTTGRWTWLDELVSEEFASIGAERFAELWCDHVNEHFAGHTFVDGTGDPAGDSMVQTNELTPFQVFNNVLERRKMPVRCYPAQSNDFLMRREAIAHALNRNVDGYPMLVIGPKCNVGKKGLQGGYQYKRVKVAGDDRYHDKPDKNKYSHCVEAGGYMMLGAGEGVSLVQPIEDTEPVKQRSRVGRSRIGGY